ncbi:S-layer homology domain-containing protein [Paenibacillus sp. NEAU-GSW1]|uniref:S-layer homology domain-containing protein n=1 Tax=Paenibacillus sp. NEAU-GSW1 TaxID=2682486 RepID=UPI0012E31D5A|nr:S-layer homology domain-containing protein [Paenibacillus sp. NEAU-GSW1]MUT65878.1 S-layer homology domain-containing protein [Paenibacillus sp. NEAU-GSW1]
MNTPVWKKMIISSMTLMLLAGGGTAAFANGGKSADDYRKGGDQHQGQSDDDDRDDDDSDDDDDDKDDDKKDKEVKVTWKFEDEEDLAWALEYIMRLSAKGVFTGYEDGTFKPNQKISRIETLVAAVRLMGLREQAESEEEMNTELNFKDADKLEKKYPWAVGYVAVALENDLFSETETEVKPELNATRLWATTILIKALKLEEEAKALNNTKLDFKDAKNIPAGSVGYVALAIEKGIITGYNDNTFRPNQPVTRAELAALLDRTDSEMPDEDQDAQAITGTLKAAVTNKKITIVKADKTEVTLDIDPNVFIFREDKKAALSALEAGDTVLVRTYQNKVVFIEVTKVAEEEVSTAFTEVGLVNTVTVNAEGKLSTISVTKVVNDQTLTTIYNVDPKVKIVGNASLLVKDQLVELKGENGTVTTITIK